LWKSSLSNFLQPPLISFLLGSSSLSDTLNLWSSWIRETKFDTQNKK
jgi:hypothetical protein